MKSNAQREDYTDALGMQQDLYASELLGTGTDGGSALKQLAAERLAAHRKRRATTEAHDGRETQRDAVPQNPAMTAAAQKVRDAVKARYQQTPSFREYLAAEAEDAVLKTRAEAEIAARAAKAVADVQMQLMAELEQWPESPEPVVAAAPMKFAAETAESASEDEPFAWTSGRAVVSSGVKPTDFELEGSELRVRHYEALPQPTPPPANEIPNWVAEAAEAYHADELHDLNAEIEFRLSPEFNDHLLEPLPIQANIIEFPRQLVAARKARPRIAEGPLRTEHEQVDAERPAEFQMRIFEVEPEQISVEPPVPEQPVQHEAPEWQSLMLGASQAPALPPAYEAAAQAGGEIVQPTLQHREFRERAQLHVASFELRLMSAVVDAACIGASALLFVTAAAVMTGVPTERVSVPVLGVFLAVLLVVMFVMYQGVFFSLGKSTPGMYYAELVFRGVDNGEPTKSALRKRVGANLVAIAPLGLGLVWSLFDRDRLGWNDRLSGVYLKEF